ncbi:MAG: hypothetical protein J6I73_07625 [Treponema sp.]|nr:hypothetical protein [Treponema sp.]
MKIAIIEANFTGLNHAYPNGIYTEIFRKLSDNEHVDLFCSGYHYENLSVEKSKIVFHPLRVLLPGKMRILKFFLEYFQSINIITKTDADLYVFLSAFPNVQFFLTKYLTRNKNKKVILFTHGEMEGLISKGKWKIWSYPFWVTLCSKIKMPSNLYRIVLGEGILENMKRFKKFSNIYSIEQPRDGFMDKNEIRPTMHNNKFAFIGNCLYKKGGETIIRAAESIEQNSESSISIIGAYDLKLNNIPKKIKLLSTPHQLLRKDDFENALSSIAYACFPYPSNTYKFTASGAVLDAIRWLKPIIYIHNDYFDAIFKDAGDIGYACADESAFIDTIIRIDESPDNERYKKQIDNLRKLQNKFKIDTVTESIAKIVFEAK